jgi:hypothetical protein
MSNIQKTLDALQPYVIGIRYVDGLPVVDTVFKDGWTVPESNLVTKVKGNEDLNYYMIFSEKDGIGLDELLEYVDTTIKSNIEKEKKQELLKEKVNELKEVFKKTSLTKLKKLIFTFNEDDLMSDLDNFDLDSHPPISLNEEKNQNPVVSELNETNKELTDEDIEILEEEQRAENFRKSQEAKKLNGQLNNIKNKVELPPKSENFKTKENCDCGPDEACNKCIENKTL